MNEPVGNQAAIAQTLRTNDKAKAEIVKARLELDAMAVCLEQLKGLPDREAQHRALTWLTARLDMGRLSYGD